MATSPLSRRAWRPLAALVAVGLCFGALVLLGPAGTDEARRRAHRAWPDYRSGSVESFDVARAGGATTHLSRRGDGWWLGDGGRADASAVEELLVAIEFGRVVRRAEPSLAPAAAGLSPPRLAFTTAGSTLALGGRDPLGDGCLARRDGGPILVVDSHLCQLLDGAPDGLRSRALLAGGLAPRAARSIQIGALELERDPSGHVWRLVGPDRARTRVDPLRVEAILAVLGDARASRLAAPADGTSDGEAATSVRLDGVERARLGGPCATAGELLVRRDDQARLCFSAAALAPLRAPSSSLRELRPFPLAVAGVRSISLERDGRRLLLERGAEGWRVRGGDAESRPTPADEDAVRELLDALAAASGSPAVTVVRAPAPLYRLTAATQLGDRLTLDVIGTAASGFAALRDGESAPLLVSAELLALLDPDALRFRPRRVLSLHAADLAHLTVDDGGARLELARPTATSPWHSPDGAPVDQVAVTRLADALLDLRARRFVAVSADSAPTRALRRLTAGPVSLTLLRRDADGCLARLDGDAAGFQLAAAACGDLLAPLRR